MANLLSSDIYELSDFTTQISKKYMDDITEENLFLGTFGMLSDVSANMLQNAIVVSGELSNEAIPTRAKFDRNVITHALSVGIKDINATPSTMKVMLCLPEPQVLNNMIDGKFTLDKNVSIFVDDIEFHLDYDLIISRTLLADNKTYVYSAIYDTLVNNPTSDIISPYLPPISLVRLSRDYNALIVLVTLRQVTYTEVYHKILVDNMIENKTFNFNYEGQLAAFDIIVTEPDGDKKYLTPIYDGLYDSSLDLFCYYNYIDSTNIRVKFNKEIYEPTANSEVMVRVYTTRGGEGNFTYKDDILVTINPTERFAYNSLYMIIKQRGDNGSFNGENKSSISNLQKKIPKEALSRGSVTNSTDLNNYFNAINTSTSTLKVFRKRDNPLERLYYSYNLIKDTNNNVIPTNTVDLEVNKSLFIKDGEPATTTAMVLAPGSKIVLDKGPGGKYIAHVAKAGEGYIESNECFIYMNPLAIQINTNPLYASYYLDIIHDTRYLSFSFINPTFGIQFIASSIDINRNFFTDRNTYHIDMQFAQNIQEDFGIVKVDPDTLEVETTLKVIALLYRDKDQEVPHRYAIGDIIVNEDDDDFVYNYRFSIDTDNIMTNDNTLKLTNVYEPGSDNIIPGYFKEVMYADIYILNDIKDDSICIRNDLDKYIPGLEGYTITNIYSVDKGINLFYNYTETINSAIRVSGNFEDALYNITKVPLVRYNYITSEERMGYMIHEMRVKIDYIKQCLESLESTFGIDYKLFNTYGPSTVFHIDEYNYIDKVNLTLTFKIKFYSNTDRAIINYIIADIKAYMEDINEISDLHMPNLITLITTKYREQIVYFEFVSINNYTPGDQHITMEDNFEESSKTPEFLNINTLDDDSPDINIMIM